MRCLNSFLLYCDESSRKAAIRLPIILVEPYGMSENKLTEASRVSVERKAFARKMRGLRTIKLLRKETEIWEVSYN